MFIVALFIRAKHWKQPKCVIWLDKQILVYLYNKIPLRNKKEQTTDTCNNIDESQKYYVEEKKSDIKQ